MGPREKRIYFDKFKVEREEKSKSISDNNYTNIDKELLYSLQEYYIDITNIINNTLVTITSIEELLPLPTDINNTFVYKPGTGWVINNLNQLLNTTIKYGYLYNWYAATNVKGITSSDTWTVPTSDEYDTLITYLGGLDVVGGKLKATGTTYWTTPNTGATNEVNFNALPSGYREDGTFANLRNNIHLLSITEQSETTAYNYNIGYDREELFVIAYNKNYGSLIRLMRDATAAEQLLADGTYLENYIGNNGYSYRTVKIGTQVWTVENLVETLYRDGTFINKITDGTEWQADTTGAYCAYDNDESNVFNINDNIPLPYIDPMEVSAGTPTDTDFFTFFRNTYTWYKVTGANLKAYLKTYFDTLYSTLSDLTGYLKLDQTTPQTIINGIPLLDATNGDFDNEKQIVNKEYVDKQVTSIGSRFYMIDTASGTEDYKLCQITPSADPEASDAHATVINEEYLRGWISPMTGLPTKLIVGVYDWVIFAQQTGGTGKKDLRLYWELVEYKADTSEVVIATSNMSNLISNTKARYDIFLTLSTDYAIASDSYVVGKIYASVTGSGGDPSVTLFYEGASDSHWEIPTNIEVLQDTFALKDLSNTDISGLTEETTPSTGMIMPIQLADGTVKKIDYSNVGSSGTSETVGGKLYLFYNY